MLKKYSGNCWASLKHRSRYESKVFQSSVQQRNERLAALKLTIDRGKSIEPLKWSVNTIGYKMMLHTFQRALCNPLRYTAVAEVLCVRFVHFPPRHRTLNYCVQRIDTFRFVHFVFSRWDDHCGHDHSHLLKFPSLKFIQNSQVFQLNWHFAISSFLR